MMRFLVLSWTATRKTRTSLCWILLTMVRFSKLALLNAVHGSHLLLADVVLHALAAAEVTLPCTPNLMSGWPFHLLWSCSCYCAQSHYTLCKQARGYQPGVFRILIYSLMFASFAASMGPFTVNLWEKANSTDQDGELFEYVYSHSAYAGRRNFAPVDAFHPNQVQQPPPSNL